MRLWTVWGCLALAGAMISAAPASNAKKADASSAAKPTTRPAATKPSAKGRAADIEPTRLLVPVAKISTLTEEQRRKLTEIAEQADRDRAAIMQKAREASFAVLTEEQKAEVAAYKQKAQATAAKRKADALKKKEERERIREEKAKIKGQKPKTDKPAEGTARS